MFSEEGMAILPYITKSLSSFSFCTGFPFFLIGDAENAATVYLGNFGFHGYSILMVNLEQTFFAQFMCSNYWVNVAILKGFVRAASFLTDIILPCCAIDVDSSNE